jgi:hypothetical protein
MYFVIFFCSKVTCYETGGNPSLGHEFTGAFGQIDLQLLVLMMDPRLPDLSQQK